MIGSRTGGGGRPGTCGMTSSMVTSDISTNSKSRILFTTFGAMAAAGLNGPGVDMSGSGAGVLSKLAAAASRSRPSVEARSGSNSGKGERDPAARGCASKPVGGGGDR